MKNFLFLITFSMTLTVFGQSSFNYQTDFEKILAQTKDTSNNLFYDYLLTRFITNDTTLTDYEVLALLIGYTDKAEYKPYTDLTTERKIYEINGDGKYYEAMDSANIFLMTHPLSVKVIFEKSYSFYKLGQKDSAVFSSYKGRRICEAMCFSGNGMTPQTPTFALGPADGQDYIRRFIGSRIGGAKIGVMGSGRDSNGNFLDILEVVPNDGTPSYNLYFIIQHATDKMFSKKDMEKIKESYQEIEKSDKKPGKRETKIKGN